MADQLELMRMLANGENQQIIQMVESKQLVVAEKEPGLDANFQGAMTLRKNGVVVGRGFSSLGVALVFDAPLAVVDCLLKAGADPLVSDAEDEHLPLHLAAEKGKLDIVRRLLQEEEVKVDVQKADGATPLLLAAFNNHFEVCEFLLDKGANPNHVGHFGSGKSVLGHALEKRTYSVALLLLYHGAHVDPVSQVNCTLFGHLGNAGAVMINNYKCGDEGCEEVCGGALSDEVVSLPMDVEGGKVYLTHAALEGGWTFVRGGRE